MIRDVVTFGFSPGSGSLIVTLGFSIGAAIPITDPKGFCSISMISIGSIEFNAASVKVEAN